VAGKKTKAKKTSKPKAKKTAKHAAPRKAKPQKMKGKRKDKFSMTWDEMKESKEWKSDWDDDAGDFEGESTEY